MINRRGANQTVLIRGCGDVGSAVAHALFKSGYRVALHDEPRPAHTRRGMAFTNALFERKAELSGVLAKHHTEWTSVVRMMRCGKALPVASGDFAETLFVLQPDILVDARMRKRSVPAALRGQARITVGLGPNFVAGE